MKQKGLVLIIDTFDTILGHCEAWMRGRYEWIHARSGTEGLALAESVRPDLILMEVMMPGMDGYEICRRLKRASATKDIPVVFVTALDHEEDIYEGLLAGAIDYITKPFYPRLLDIKIHNVIAQLEQSKAGARRNPYPETGILGV